MYIDPVIRQAGGRLLSMLFWFVCCRVSYDYRACKWTFIAIISIGMMGLYLRMLREQPPVLSTDSFNAWCDAFVWNLVSDNFICGPPMSVLSPGWGFHGNLLFSLRFLLDFALVCRCSIYVLVLLIAGQELVNFGWFWGNLYTLLMSVIALTDILTDQLFSLFY